MGSTLFGKNGLVLESAGEITADRNGLWSGSCRFSLPHGRVDLIPAVLSVHPHVGFLFAEKFRLSTNPGLWRVSVDYVGASVDSSEPQYELSPGTGNEPIQTHKDFIATIAGTPSSPKNGAIFRDPVSGEISTDDDLAEFDRFALSSELAGTDSYIAQNNTVWTKSWTQKSKPTSHGVRINNPPGNAPDYGGSYNWLELPVGYTVRGRVYSCQQHWVCSGPKGWKSIVYPET